LPAVDQVLRIPEVAALSARIDARLLAAFAALVLDAWREEIRTGVMTSADLGARLARGEHVRAILDQAERELRRGIRRAINATGVVLNTGLGRAPVHAEAAEAMAEAARAYCVLEVDRETGARNQRDDRLSELLCRLTGAEAAIAVNNNAGAVLLAFQTFAGGREAIVSRGELVEIGGSFRVPDVMARANVTLVEVGTTNRTRAADYRAAMTPRTGLLMKVHTSNFRVVGFTECVSPGEIAGLGRERGIVSAFDLGSGLVEESSAPALAGVLGGEPLVADAVKSGVDVVTFSGDKLLGAPQAGLMVGKRAAIDALRKNPIYRALRLDKVALAGLEKTIELWLAGRAAEIPVRAMLARSEAEMRQRAEAIAASIQALPGFRTSVRPDGSEPGSGSAPGVTIPTFVVRVEHARASANALVTRLRQFDPPVFARIHEGGVLVDPRTLLAGDEADLVRAFATAVGS
jgi:L-seryl-tRNA(Ser) seleniumtransferase